MRGDITLLRTESKSPLPVSCLPRHLYIPVYRLGTGLYTPLLRASSPSWWRTTARMWQVEQRRSGCRKSLIFSGTIRVVGGPSQGESEKTVCGHIPCLCPLRADLGTLIRANNASAARKKPIASSMKSGRKVHPSPEKLGYNRD